MKTNIRQALETLTPLKGLSPSFLDSLAECATLRVVRAGGTVFCQDEPSPYCFGILSGEVTIQRVSKQNRYPPKILGVVGAGDLFGEGALFNDSPRTAMASVQRDGELIAIFGTKFREGIQKDPTTGVSLLMELLNRSLERLHQTSQELSVVYGVVGLLGSDETFVAQMTAILDYLKSSLDAVDEALFFQRSAFWDEFEAICLPEPHASVAAFPTPHPVVQTVRQLSNAAVFTVELQQALATHLGNKDMKAAVAVPLPDRAATDSSLQGFLVLMSRQSSTAFSNETPLLLFAVATPIAEALARHRRQQASSAEARPQQARESHPC